MGANAKPLAPAVRAELATRFTDQGRDVYGTSNDNSSPLYAWLSLAVADDPAVLALVAEADRATVVPNLLFAAVHYLLLGDPTAPLVAYYPDLTDAPRPTTEAYPVFRVYCLAHAEEIRRLVTTRRVQTNEVGRCAALLPAFTLVAARGRARPLALVEIGASAGLLMLWDRYRYTYRAAPSTDAGADDALAASALYAGDPASPVQIITQMRGDRQPPLPTPLPPVAYRVGLDLHPIDAGDDDATRWLRALIWPEHADRRRLLQAALDVARADPPRLVAGDAASEALTALLEQAPTDATLCVYHSYALNQMPADIRERAVARIADFATQHPDRFIYRISQEWVAQQEKPEIRLITYQGAEETQDDLLAYAGNHGRWLEWRHSGH